MKVPRYKRAKKAATALREFLLKHMKGKEVKIGRNLNSEIWKRGIRNPPHHVKVTVVKGDDDIIKAELLGKKYEEKTKEEREAEKKTKKKAEKKPEEGKKEEEKTVEKEKAKEVKEKTEIEKEEPKKEVKPKEKAEEKPKRTSAKEVKK